MSSVACSYWVLIVSVRSPINHVVLVSNYYFADYCQLWWICPQISYFSLKLPYTSACTFTSSYVQVYIFSTTTNTLWHVLQTSQSPEHCVTNTNRTLTHFDGRAFSSAFFSHLSCCGWQTKETECQKVIEKLLHVLSYHESSTAVASSASIVKRRE